eukprot:1945908-Amphidinium_carterae.4
MAPDLQLCCLGRQGFAKVTRMRLDADTVANLRLDVAEHDLHEPSSDWLQWEAIFSAVKDFCVLVASFNYPCLKRQEKRKAQRVERHLRRNLWLALAEYSFCFAGKSCHVIEVSFANNPSVMKLQICWGLCTADPSTTNRTNVVPYWT